MYVQRVGDFFVQWVLSDKTYLARHTLQLCPQEKNTGPDNPIHLSSCHSHSRANHISFRSDYAKSLPLKPYASDKINE